ncbi:hypothetical protein BJ875DRAFT_525040 [Amylocarpus encephaloides]|uniref:Uncharacterized protein n=1 Tax=Amylocarpus encephaloides TaxID=45428 RepID=A0A9P8C069_9HELO|nr:hypothetical protein BJ875DRAFT_525040 [Amylocarpus encephaloides]
MGFNQWEAGKSHPAPDQVPDWTDHLGFRRNLHSPNIPTPRDHCVVTAVSPLRSHSDASKHATTSPPSLWCCVIPDAGPAARGLCLGGFHRGRFPSPRLVPNRHGWDDPAAGSPTSHPIPRHHGQVSTSPLSTPPPRRPLIPIPGRPTYKLLDRTVVDPPRMRDPSSEGRDPPPADDPGPRMGQDKCTDVHASGPDHGEEPRGGFLERDPPCGFAIPTREVTREIQGEVEIRKGDPRDPGRRRRTRERSDDGLLK